MRAETRKLPAFSEKEVEDIFDKKIKSSIDAAIESKTDDLLAQIVGKSERTREQRQHLKMALESILARIERGMTVEIRFLPPAPTTEAVGEKMSEAAAFASLKHIAPQLVFPEAAENPVLQLSHAEQK